jgi:hypothetical protein
MGRSVSTHRHAVATVYLNPEIEDEDFGWDDFLSDLRDNVLVRRYPSLEPCNRWLDREDHIILQNQFCEVSVSEYCGCVAVCLAPADPDDAYKVAWCERVAASFERYVEKCYRSCAMRRIGGFSNGESVYQKIAE